MRDDLCLEPRDARGGGLAVPVEYGKGLLRRRRHARLRLHLCLEFVELVDAFGDHQTELRRQPAHRVCQHRLLLHQQRTYRVQRQHTLLLRALHRYELHLRL